MKTFLPYEIHGMSKRPHAGIALLVIALVIAFSVFAALTPGFARASVVIAEDDFEGHQQDSTGHGWLDEWSFNADVDFRNNGRPHGGNSHLRLRDEDASAVRSVEVTGESSLRLQVWVKEEDFDGDTAVIEVSNDGTTYVELHEWDDDNDYAFFDFDLAATGLTFPTQIWIRARILGDEDEGTLYIDDLVLLNSDDDPEPDPPTSGVPVLIDGQFPDWPGKANLSDVSGDQTGSTRGDISTFYWANNIDEEINFHMLERHTTDGQPLNGSNGQNGIIRYFVHIDTNNNGNYTESEDRRAIVTYAPTSNSSVVNVKVYPGDSFSKISDSGWNDWGDSKSEGGLRVEFPLNWDDLDIQFGGVIRMYAESFDGLGIFPIVRDRVPDGNADIQWSPASVLGPWLLGAASIVGIFVIWFISRRRRLWT